jgi:hypothetical protein
LLFEVRSSSKDEIKSLERRMGEVVRFVPKSELERNRLVREARAIYESVFPPVAAVNKQRSAMSPSRSAGGADVRRHDDVSS